MKEDELNEKLKLVAEFDGYTIGKLSGWAFGDRGECAYKKDEHGEICEATPINKLKYNTDWNDLHRVWSLFVYVNIKNSDIDMWKKYHDSIKVKILFCETPELAFKILYEAIKWYNLKYPKEIIKTEA